MGISFPNVRSCVALACVLADGTLVGAHMSERDDIDRVTPRLKAAMGQEAIKGCT
jgi:hypothetical protein